MATTLNQANYGTAEFGVSPLKTINSKANPGQKYSFYWVLIYMPDGEIMYCATSESLTKIMGDSCTDKKFCEEVIPQIVGQYEVAEMRDKDTNALACFEDGTQIYCLRKRAHRMAAKW